MSYTAFQECEVWRQGSNMQGRDVAPGYVLLFSFLPGVVEARGVFQAAALVASVRGLRWSRGALNLAPPAALLPNGVHPLLHGSW